MSKELTTEQDSNIRYGRLQEAVHVSTYEMERACSSLEYLLDDDRWQKVGLGFEDINAFLRSIDMSDVGKIPERRKAISKKLEALQASQRATAKALGVNQSTVSRDLDANASKPKPATHEKTADTSKSDASTSLTPNVLDLTGGEVAKTAEKDATKAYDKAALYGHDEGDEWYTPRWIFDSLGLRYSIDVCAPSDLTHVTTPADSFLTEAEDGLTQPWHGTIWCNPPYSAPDPWAVRCVEHGDGLLLTHIPMNADWCTKVWAACDGIRLFQAIEFVRPDGKTQRPGSWLQLAAFGETATAALAQMVTPAEVAENPRRVPSPMWVQSG